MKTLILSCNTGQGHNSCAAAIKEVFDANHQFCEVADTLGFISKRASRFVARWHTRIYRHVPGAFRWGYAYSEEHASVFNEKSAVYKLLTSGAERLGGYIADGGFDTVICTHVFSALILTAALRQCGISVRSYYVATDYTCSPSMDGSDLDGYFIPDERLCDDFTVGSIGRERIIPIGIPVLQKFFMPIDKAFAKKALGIPRENAHLVMMCGSMGCGPMQEIAELLAGSLTENQDISIVCGTNRRLYRRLRETYAANHHIHVYAYVKNMPLLLSAADLYLTKPGGISVTEAAAKRVPMVFIDAVAGCEAYNRQFFIDAGGAGTADTNDGLAKLCIALLSDPQKLEQMAQSLARTLRGNPARQMYAYLRRQDGAGENAAGS